MSNEAQPQKEVNENVVHKDDCIKVTLSSGHIVTMKKSLTWNDQKKIDAPLHAGRTLKVDPNNKDENNQPIIEHIEFKSEILDQQNQARIMVLTTSIVDEKGHNIGAMSEITLGKLDVVDYDLLNDVATEIYNEVQKKRPKTEEKSQS